MHLIFFGARRMARTMSAALLIGVTACSALDVNSPTTLRIENLENAIGAQLAVKGARFAYMQAIQSAIMTTGELSDELGEGDQAANQRTFDPLTQSGLYKSWQIAYRQATTDISLVRRFAPETTRGAQLGEVFALRGYAMLGLAEHVCPGFPLVKLDIDGNAVSPRFDSDPQTTDSAFLHALADFDSALFYAGDSIRVRSFAQIGKGRALLGLGRFSEATAAVTGVDVGYADTTVTEYGLWYGFATDFSGHGAQEREGGNGIDFVSSHDPRLDLQSITKCCFVTYEVPAKYMDFGYFVPVVTASGIEARLIAAEGELATDPEGLAWLESLNVLRRTVALSDTTDPGTSQGRVDLLFRERAMWLFATAHRLGDLRRLVARYGRDQETVFPTGLAANGQPYGTWTSVPFNGEFEHQYNSKITGCTSR